MGGPYNPGRGARGGRSHPAGRGARQSFGKGRSWEEEPAGSTGWSGGGAESPAAAKYVAVKYADQFLAREVRPYPGEDHCSFFKRRGSRSDAESLDLSRVADCAARGVWVSAHLYAMSCL